MPSVAVTRVRVGAWRHLPIVVFHLARVAMRERRAEGSLSVEVLQEARGTFWMRSVWSTEAAMQDFFQRGAGRAVMRQLARWCDEAATARWPQLSSAPPPWLDAHRRLQDNGRPSRVDRPSSDHLGYRIREPDVERARRLRFK